MIKISIIIFVIYLFSTLVLFLFQEKIIFQNTALPADHTYSFQRKFEEITIKSDKENTINALHFKVENPKGVLLYFHGNRGNLERWGGITAYFKAFDYDVFVMDYRSYGKSTGKLHENKMYQDAQRCYDYVATLYPEKEITVYGRSLGCTFAIKMAAENKPKQLILEAPFYNLTDVAKHHYPLIPFKFLLKYKFKSDTFIGKVTCKTTIFHGKKDNVVPFSSGKKLYKKANAKHTTFISIATGTHHNLFDFEAYEKEIYNLLQ